jgi:hypothetical protein
MGFSEIRPLKNRSKNARFNKFYVAKSVEKRLYQAVFEAKMAKNE